MRIGSTHRTAARVPDNFMFSKEFKDADDDTK